MKTYREIMAVRAEKARRYRAAHPDRIRARNVRYYQSHREECLAINKRWREKNRPWLKIQCKQRRTLGWAAPIAELKAAFPHG
jgi:hypothetical protein